MSVPGIVKVSGTSILSLPIHAQIHKHYGNLRFKFINNDTGCGMSPNEIWQDSTTKTIMDSKGFSQYRLCLGSSINSSVSVHIRGTVHVASTLYPLRVYLLRFWYFEFGLQLARANQVRTYWSRVDRTVKNNGLCFRLSWLYSPWGGSNPGNTVSPLDGSKESPRENVENGNTIRLYHNV